MMKRKVSTKASTDLRYKKRRITSDNNANVEYKVSDKVLNTSSMQENGIFVISDNDNYEETNQLDSSSDNESISSQKSHSSTTSTPNSTIVCAPRTPVGCKIVEEPYELWPKKNSILEGRKDTFDLLSDEIILMIFKKLDKQSIVSCACVCQRWRNIAYDNDLWSRIDASCRKIMPDSVIYILLRKPTVLRMAQTEVAYPMFDKLSYLMENFTSKLEYLDLSLATIKTSDLRLLLSKCANLIKLSLESCVLSNGVCREISKNCNLTVLNMASCYNVHDDGLSMILSRCKRLEELNIAWVNLDELAILSVCRLLTANIKKLNISGCLKKLEDDHIGLLVSRCTELTELDLSDCTVITQLSIVYIIDGLENLEHLSLSRCYAIRPTKYCDLFTMPSLRYLNIFGLFQERNIEVLQSGSATIQFNKFKFSSIARPTVGVRRTSIWGLAVRNQ